MIHHFDTEVAQKYGVDCAIIISNFQHWITRNAANGINFHDGRHWTFNSKKALSVIFPYWSENQIKRSLLKLVECGILVTGNYNKNSFDKTNWYAFVDEARWIELPSNIARSIGRKTPTETMDEMGCTLGDFAQCTDNFAQPIPYNKHKIVNNQIVNEKKINKVAAKKIAAFSQPELGVEDAEIGTPVALPPLEKQKTLYSKMVDVYFAWHEKPEVAGVKPLFDKIQGKALNEIIDYFTGVSRAKLAENGNNAPAIEEVEGGVLKAWEFLLNAMLSPTLKDFYKEQVKVTQIRSNMSNLMVAIKKSYNEQRNINTGARPTGFEGLRG